MIEKSHKMKIIVTIPAYNEEETIENVIKNVKSVMNKKYKYEILVVDDGSTDETAQVAKNLGVIVHSHPYNRGLAEVFRTEMRLVLERKADIIVHIDADGQYLPEEIPKLLEPVIKGEADLVLGSRFAGTIESMPFLKRLGNRLFSKVISGIINYKVTDCQTGFRAFTREVAKNISVRSTHTYTQEVIIKAVRHNFRIKDVPVYFAKRTKGKSRLISNPFEYAFKAWINIFRIYRDFEPLKFFGLLGLFLIFTGLFVFTFSSLFFNKIMDITTLIFILFGIQTIILGFLADMKTE